MYDPHGTWSVLGFSRLVLNCTDIQMGKCSSRCHTFCLDFHYVLSFCYLEYLQISISQSIQSNFSQSVIRSVHENLVISILLENFNTALITVLRNITYLLCSYQFIKHCLSLKFVLLSTIYICYV